VANANLHNCLLQCRYHGIAQSTRQTYQSGLAKFHLFCNQHTLTSVPTSSLTFQYFCAQESQTVSYKTIKVYLAAIHLRHIECGLPDPTPDNLLQLVCRGICHLQGDNQQTRLPQTRLPISINLMHTLKDQLHQSSYEQWILWVAFIVVFYGFLRVSEYTNLCGCDVTSSVDHISIHLQDRSFQMLMCSETV